MAGGFIYMYMTYYQIIWLVIILTRTNIYGHNMLHARLEKTSYSMKKMATNRSGKNKHMNKKITV